MRPLARDLAAGLLDALGITSAARQAAGALSVATFHRVLPAAQLRAYPLPQLVVTPEELAWFLGWFRERYTCGPLAELHRRWLGGERPARPFLALTFDDGQRDNFEHAWPALERAGLRATFFAPVDAVEDGAPLWHDRAGFAAAALLADDPEGARALFAELGPPAEAPEAQAGEAVRRAKRLAPAERVAWVARLEARLARSARPAWDGLMT
jgi:peptidoglycan/xylan/chitin deacetylase (PgdA/CDA1 family)